jgi:FixJ family two-component response regulator
MPDRADQSVVFVIDDDASVRESLLDLFASVGLHALAFASPAEFLSHKVSDGPSCLVLDVRLPGLSGLDFQAELAKAKVNLPVIFITGHGDIPMTVRAMKAGAVEFLTKPFRDQDLLAAIEHALERDRARRREHAERSVLHTRYATLTPREREVMTLVVSGRLNKQSAAELGITETTVKVHRHHVMAKMDAGSLADLVRMWEKLG